jgi:hypothetical protein
MPFFGLMLSMSAPGYRFRQNMLTELSVFNDAEDLELCLTSIKLKDSRWLAKSHKPCNDHQGTTAIIGKGNIGRNQKHFSMYFNRLSSSA